MAMRRIFRFFCINRFSQRLNMELDLQSLFGLLCTALQYTLTETPQLPPPVPRIWALLASQDRRHLFVFDLASNSRIINLRKPSS
jgi:hypothetical protein